VIDEVTMKREERRRRETVRALVVEADGEEWAVRYLLACIRAQAERHLIHVDVSPIREDASR
jgi:hypothetical protein